MAHKGTRKEGKEDLPKLLTCKEFGYLIGRKHEWVRDACREGRIPSAQYVANFIWVIPQDALIVPRYLEGFPHHLLDVGLPEEFIISGKRTEVPRPMELNRNPSKNIEEQVKLYTLPSLRKVREDKGWSLRGLATAAKVDKAYLSRLERGLQKCRYRFARRLSDTLGVDIEELMNIEIGE